MTTKVALAEGEGTAMPKHGTALTPGQQKEFLETGLGALVLLSHDPDLDPTTADGWARNSEAFERVLRQVLIPSLPDPAKGIVKTVTVVIGGGRTTDQIVETAKKLEGKNRPSYINPAITQANMPSGHSRCRPVVLEFFEFDHDPTTEEIRARCEEPGYGYSTYEDGLRFQEDRPDDQRERPHIFVPENPWCVADCSPQALRLWSDTGGRKLSLDHCHLGFWWFRRCLFARRKYC